jgi:glycyl-tRNA synthetase beta chain
MSRDLLIEIGCEEIPARMIRAATRDLQGRLLAVLDQAGFPHGEARAWGGARRLAVLVAAVAPALEGRDETIVGPPASVAFGPDGAPTPAGAGFARKQGIDPSALLTITTEKGTYAGFSRTAPGRSLQRVLADALPASVSAMTFPKTMRWGAGTHRWVRPVHWVVALHGSEVLDLEILGARSGRRSQGHRFLSEGPVAIDDAGRYVDVLRDARVLADAGERRAALAGALGRAAAAVGGLPVPDDALLDELVDLVEWPGVVVGRFDPAFLELPREILVTTLRHHQKAFSVHADGELLPAFLAVANTDRDPSGHVRRGNEWVVVGRLDDARFFWNEDAGRTLASRLVDLERVTFHQKVGTYAALTKGIGTWTTLLANELKLTPEDRARAVRAAELCKADLVTGLVGEFPELQGVIGGLLLRREGGDPAVADAIADQYLPTGPDAPLPRSQIGCIVALAERIQTVQSLIKIGEVPTGSRDPFGLRRAANAIFRILIERRWPIEFAWILRSPEETQFWTERLFNFFVEQGFTVPEVRSVLMVGDSGAAFRWPLHAIVSRLEAVRSVRSSRDFNTLLLLTKRIHNITPQVAQLERTWLADGWLPTPARYEEYSHPEPAARALKEALAAQQPKVERAASEGDYRTSILELAALAEPVSRFFDDVLVIDEAQRDDTHHRSQLVGRLGALLTRYFDIRELAGQAEGKR